MPTLFVKDGYRFFFYSADYNEPIHVHVEYGEGKAKFWIDPLILASSYKMRAPDLKKAQELVVQNKKFIEDKWYEFFGKKRV